MTNNNKKLQQLISTIKTLRGVTGCPWDKKQTPETLIKYLKSEMDELISAIQNDDPENTCEELGDLLYILIMIASCNDEKAFFDFSDVITQVNKKLIRRHPHVFAGKSYKNEAELDRQWQEIKAQEKRK